MARPDLAELLAHLDLLVERPKTTSLENSEEHINYVLTELTRSLDNRYTVMQIKKCLWKAFRTKYTYAAYNFRELFVHGSSEIPNLPPDVARSVKMHLDTLRLRHAYQSQRGLRSGSYQRTSVTKNKTKSRQSRTRVQDFEKSSTKSAMRNVAATQTGSEKKHTRKTQSSEVSSRRLGEQAATVSPSIEIDETPPNSPIAASSTRSVTHDSCIPGEDAHENKTGWSRPTKKALGDNEIDRRGDETTGASTSAIDLDNQYSYMQTDLATFKQRCEDLEQERASMQIERRHMLSLYDQSNGLPEELSKIVQQTIQKNIQLKKRLNDRQDLEPYLTIKNASSRPSTAHQIMTFFQTLREQLSEIRFIDSMNTPCISDAHGASEDLDFLLTTLGIGKQVRTNEISESFTALNIGELVQALTGAAIYRWVLESEYKSHMMTVTPLLLKYRDLISTWYGHERLCDLDTAVHQALIGEKSFMDMTIARQTSTLTNRLLSAIQPLLDQKSVKKITRQLSRSLDCIMKLAVQIRSLTLVGNEEFECIWPLFGSLADENEMEIKNSKPSMAAALVRLPLCPGLRAYSKTTSMVGYHGLESCRSSQPPKYVVKAMIQT